MRHFLSLLGALSLCAIPLTAGELKLSDAIEAARGYNGDLKVATLQLQQTLRRNAVDDWLPSVRLELGASASASIADERFSSSYTIGGISWSFDSADHHNDRESRALSNESASLAYQSQVESVKGRVTTAYWNAQAAVLALQNKEDSLRQAQDDLADVQARYEAGKATTLAVSQEKVQESDAEYDVLIARQTLSTALRTLKDLTGIAVDETTTFEALPETGTLQSVEELEAGIEATTTIRQYDLAIAQARQDLAAQKTSSVRPSVSVTARTSLSDAIYSRQNGDGTWGLDDLSDSTSVSATVSIPLDHLFRNSSASVTLDSLSLAIDIATQRRQNAVDDLKTRIENAWTSATQAERNLAKLQAHLELAEEQLSLLEASYDAGKTSVKELNDAKDTVSDASLAVIQQQLERTIAVYDIATLLECPVEAILN